MCSVSIYMYMYVSILISTYVKCTISIIIDNFPAQGLDEK